MGSTLLSSITIGRETLMTHGSAMATLSDNVSNSNTTGFKAGGSVFADLLARGEGSVGDTLRASAGDGTTVSTKYIFNQGPIEPTSRPADFAIEGDGFFVVAKPDATGAPTNEVFYSRAGNFTSDADGRLVTTDGYLVMGFIGENNQTLAPIPTGGAPVPATVTSTGYVSGNLSADAEVVVGAIPDQFANLNQLESMKPYPVPIRVVDSLGKAHEATINFFKTGANEWTARAYIDGAEVAGGTEGVPTAIGPATVIQFDQNGQPTVPNVALNINANWANGAAASTVAVDMSDFTGYAQNSTVYRVTQNGVLAGVIQGIEIDDKGVISQRLSNGQLNEIGTLALARFPNNEGLSRIGQTLFFAGPEAGEVTYDAPMANGRGSLVQGALENSNVDLADQFVKVIQVQRTYQAGSQVIQTANGLLETTLQIA